MFPHEPHGELAEDHCCDKGSAAFQGSPQLKHASDRSKDDLERKLLFVCACPGPVECARCLAPQQHLLHREISSGPRSVRRCGRGSTSTRNSQKVKIWTRRGSLDFSASAGPCLALRQNLQDATGRTSVEEVLDASLPEDKKLPAAVRCCHVQEAWDGAG